MSKRKAHPLVFRKKEDGIIRINAADIKTRKPQPPPVQVHKTKTEYRRNPKHRNKEEE